MGLFARAIGVIVSPTATFGSIVAHPRSAAIVFLASLIFGLASGLPQMTEQGRQAAVDMQVQQIERWTGQRVTDEQYSRMLEGSRFAAYFSIGSMLIFLPVVAMIFAAIYWAVFNALLGGTASFKQVLAVVSHSMVIGAVGQAAGAPIQYARGTITPGGPFNLGALLPMLEPSSFLAQFLGLTNVFTLWSVVVTAIGLGVLYRRRPTGIAVALLVVTGLFIGAGAYFMSRTAA
jgi:hypothetical protein